MGIRVKLPNGQYGNFPDGTPNETIESVLQKQFPPQAEEKLSDEQLQDKAIRETTGFKGLAYETLLNLSNAMKNSVLFAKDLPSMTKQAVEAEKERPLRPWAVTGGQLAEIGKGAINAPYNLNQLLARKFSSIPTDIAGIGIPHIPEDTGVGSLFGLDEQQPEDRLYKGLTNALTALAPTEVGQIKGVEGAAPKRVLPKHLEAQISKERKVLDRSKERLSQFKESLESHPEYRSGKPSSLRRSAGDLEAKIKEIEPLTQIAEKNVPDMPVAPDTAKMKRMAAGDVTQAKELLSGKLGEGKNFASDAGAIFDEEIGSVHKAASKQFKDTRDYFADKDIAIDKSSDIKGIKDKISELQAEDKDLPGYAFDTPEIKSLQEQLDKLEKPESVKASDVLDLYQTLQKLAKRTNDEIYTRGSKLTESEFKEKKQHAQRYSQLADNLGDILENVGDKNGIKMMKDARSAWKEYASLYGNPIFHSLEKHKAIPQNTIGKLSVGTSGNELLNKIVEKRPELRELIFGQKYANPSTHKALLRPSKVNEAHLDKLPDVKELVDALKDASEAEREIKSTAADMKAEHKELADAIEKEATQQQLRRDAIANVKKYRELSAKKSKAADIVKKKMNQAVARGENIDALESQLKEIEAKNARYKTLLKKAVKMVINYGGVKSALH